MKMFLQEYNFIGNNINQKSSIIKTNVKCFDLFLLKSKFLASLSRICLKTIFDKFPIQY